MELFRAITNSPLEETDDEKPSGDAAVIPPNVIQKSHKSVSTRRGIVAL
jgi:hypothetical protein